jgi:arylsulfatase A-like enzyme
MQNDTRKIYGLNVWQILEVLLVCVAAGIIMSLAIVVNIVSENNYLAMGFNRTILLETLGTVSKSILPSVISGFLLILVRGAFSVFFSRTLKPKGTIEILSNGTSRLSILLCLGMASILVHVTLYCLTWTTILCVSAIILSWTVLLNFCIKRSEVVSWLKPELFATDISTLMLLGLVVSAMFDKADAYKIMRKELLVGVALSMLLAAIVYRFVSFPVISKESNCRSNKRHLVLLLPTLIILALMALKMLPLNVFGCGVKVEKQWNVLLIGIDTLRSDHVSISGLTEKQRDLTPNLRKLAEKGTFFSNAISQSSWTLPSFASIHTGKYPLEHGAKSLSGALKESEVTLGEILREAGYDTGGIVSHVFVDSLHGFGQGMQYFNDDYALGRSAITSGKVTDKAIDFLKNKGQEKFFLFLHYLDPHYDYKDHKDWVYSDSYSGWLRNNDQSINGLRRNRHLLEASDVEYLTDLYDEEIAYTDKHIGRLLDYLKSRHLDKKTIIVVVSDHGEEFMERGWLGHTISLYDEQIKVPLIVVVPGPEPENSIVKKVVETRQVFATILDSLGISCDAKGASKNLSILSLMSPMDIEESDEKEPVFGMSSVWLADAPVGSGKRFEIVSLRSDRWKYIKNFTLDKELLFDIERDQKEQVDLSSKMPEELLLMRTKMVERIAEMRVDEQEIKLQLNEKQIKMLKSLGYL